MKMGDAKLVDSMLLDGLIDAFHGYHMGITGKRLLVLCCCVIYIQSFHTIDLKSRLIAYFIKKKFKIRTKEQTLCHLFSFGNRVQNSCVILEFLIFLHSTRRPDK